MVSLLLTSSVMVPVIAFTKTCISAGGLLLLASFLRLSIPYGRARGLCSGGAGGSGEWSGKLVMATGHEHIVSFL
jgi:hypothetical protein